MINKFVFLHKYSIQKTNKRNSHLCNMESSTRIRIDLIAKKTIKMLGVEIRMLIDYIDCTIFESEIFCITLTVRFACTAHW